MSTRYATTEYNRLQRVLSRLRDVYACARSVHSSHKEILAQLDARVYETPDYRKLTRYAIGYVHATRAALSDSLYLHDLEWRVRLDGALISSKDIPAGRWSDIRTGDHVWSADPTKLFSTPEGQED